MEPSPGAPTHPSIDIPTSVDTHAAIGTHTAIDGVVARLLAAPELWPELITLADRTEFAETVSNLAGTWGLDLSPDEVVAELDGRRRGWLERWI